MKNTEIWKDIKGCEGYYQVSNLGRVKSLARTITRSNGRVQPVKEKILRATLDNHGYFSVVLCRTETKKRYLIHQLVAMAFLGHIPIGYKKVVNHIDNDKTNNKSYNLELISQRQNCSVDKWRHGKTSKHVGVHLHGYYKDGSPIWRAQITINKKVKYLGSFRNEEQAAQAYQTALKQTTKK